jgi:hypothetical protein
LLDAPPDEIVLAPPHTVPKTSSGKLRRTSARELFERGELTLRPQPLWQQVLRLSIAGLGPQLRRTARTLGEYLYAGWVDVVVLMGLSSGPRPLLPPGQRWALMHRAARGTFWLMGIRLDVTCTWPGAAGVVVVANHASYLDGLVLAAAIPGEPAFIAKKELEPQFFAGPFLRRLGALFVERADPEGGVENVNKVSSCKLGCSPSFPKAPLRGPDFSIPPRSLRHCGAAVSASCR